MNTSLETLDLQTETLRDSLGDLDRLAESFGSRMVTAFANAATQGRKLSDVLKGLALSLAQTALSQGLKPLGSLLGGVLSQAVTGGRVTAFADGGIVNAPTLFPLRGGTGLMGEAGAEAVMPLELGAGIVMAEINSEHWLTRSWRPLLMLMLMGFLLIVGLLLPLADMIAGAPLTFEPRWQLLPPGFWDFLGVGVGGYIGGRSLEKVAGLVFPAVAAAKAGRR